MCWIWVCPDRFINLNHVREVNFFTDRSGQFYGEISLAGPHAGIQGNDGRLLLRGCAALELHYQLRDLSDYRRPEAATPQPRPDAGPGSERPQ
jgi:hypothetical protein